MAYRCPAMKAPRFSALIFLCAGLGLTGCAGADPFSRHVSQCSEAGYTPTTQAFAQCMSRRAVALVEPADERRERLRWEARLERERLAAEQRVRDEQPAMIGMSR